LLAILQGVGVIDLGPRAIKRVSWRDLIEATIEAYSTAARRPPAVLSPDSSRVLVCEIVDDEPDLAFTLDAVISVAEEDDVSVILAVDGASPENWAASQTLSLWLPRTVTVHSDARVVERLRLRADAILLVRGARAELAAADMRRLLAAAAEGPVAPLWLDTDGTVASAGLVVRGGRYQHLLAGHPREDATALGSEIVTPRPAGDTFARPFTHITASAARTLTDAVVRLPSRPPPQGVVHEEDTALGDTLARAGFVIASQSGGHLELRRPTHRVELESGELVPSLRWAIKIAAPSGRPGEYWGDTHFARGLAAALRRLGQNVVIDAYDARHRRTGYLDDVVLALRGPEPIEPHARSRSLLWIISHPDEITAAQLDGFDEIFAASVPWCDAASSRFGRQIRPLLQCTDPERFHPVGLPRGARRVFVGTARGIARPSVVEPIRAGLPIDVYGPDWTGWIPASSVVARSVPNDQLPAVYESADAVLNDHWPAMQREGFISNRLFDVVASGGRAISDEVAGIEQLFAGAVVTYATIPELLSLLRMDLDEVFPVQSRLREISSYVRRQHSFDSRARVLLDTVLDG